MHKRSVILVEPHLSGHHWIYLKYFTEVLIDLNCDVIVYAPKEIKRCDNVVYKSISYNRNIRLPKNQILKKVAVFLNLFISLFNLFSLRRKIKKESKIFFCCIDDYQHELLCPWLFNLVFPYEFSGLLFSPRDKNIFFSFDRRNMLRSKYCKSIGVLDEFCIDRLSVFQKHIVHFPDFSDESNPNMEYDQVKLIKEKANGRLIISLLGSITPRKGLKTFIHAMDLLDDNYFYFVIAGKSHLSIEDEKCILDCLSKKKNCYFYGEMIPTESDFNALFYISDIVFAAYVDFPNSSNMLAKAALFKKPLIVSKGFYMEQVVDKYNLGFLIDQDSPEECAMIIKQYYDRERLVGYQYCDEYLKSNSISNLKKSFTDVLKYFEVL